MKRIFSRTSTLIVAIAFLSALSILPAFVALAANSSAAIEAYKAVLQNEITFYSADENKNYKKIPRINRIRYPKDTR